MRKMPTEVKHGKWGLWAITTSDLYINDVLFQPYFYEQGLVKVLSKCGGEVLQSTVANVAEFRNISNDFEDTDYCFKVEGIEKLSKRVWDRLNLAVNPGGNVRTPVSCHMFLAKAGSPSFPEHTDPDDVMIYIVAGEKTMVAEGKTYVLKAGDTLWMPTGTKHYAINEKPSIMLSIGFDRFHNEKFPCTETSTSKRQKAANLTAATALLAAAIPPGTF